MDVLEVIPGSNVTKRPLHLDTSVVGTTGVKPIKLKHQLYADLNINNETYSCVFIVIPKIK